MNRCARITSTNAWQVEDRGRKVDQPEVLDGVESVRVVGGKRYCETEDGCGDRANPRPHLAVADAEPAEGHDRQPSRGDEAGDGDMEVANAVVQRRAELLDLVTTADEVVTSRACSARTDVGNRGRV